MNALQQYIDLYDANRDTVEKASPAVMNRARVEARRALSQMALPVKGSEDYEATDLNAIFATDYGVNLNQMRWQGELRFTCDVPNLSTNVYYVLNDTFVAGASAREQDGLTVETLAQAALQLLRSPFARRQPHNRSQYPAGPERHTNLCGGRLQRRASYPDSERAKRRYAPAGSEASAGGGRARFERKSARVRPHTE